MDRDHTPLDSGDVAREMIGQKRQRISRGLLSHDMLAVRTSPQSGPHRRDCHLAGWLVGVRAIRAVVQKSRSQLVTSGMWGLRTDRAQSYALVPGRAL